MRSYGGYTSAQFDDRYHRLSDLLSTKKTTPLSVTLANFRPPPGLDYDCLQPDPAARQKYEDNGRSDESTASQSNSSNEGPAVIEEVWDERARMTSRGAEQHGTGECKPCAWNWKPGGCSNGYDCEFCHSCQEYELRDRRRERIASLKKAERAQRKVKSQKEKAVRARARKRTETSQVDVDAQTRAIQPGAYWFPPVCSPEVPQSSSVHATDLMQALVSRLATELEEQYGPR